MLALFFLCLSKFFCANVLLKNIYTVEHMNALPEAMSLVAPLHMGLLMSSTCHFIFMWL